MQFKIRLHQNAAIKVLVGDLREIELVSLKIPKLQIVSYFLISQVHTFRMKFDPS